jgi:Tol biopolymer transport system component
MGVSATSWLKNDLAGLEGALGADWEIRLELWVFVRCRSTVRDFCRRPARAERVLANQVQGSTRVAPWVFMGVVVATACASQTGSKSHLATQVVFSRQERAGSQNHDIFVADGNGRSLVRLTSWPGDEQTPKFSPDGTKIVFRAASSPEDAPEIWIMNRDGTEKTNLTRTPGGTEWSPTWSPNGRNIIFSCGSSVAGAVGNDLCIMNPDGSGRRYLMRDPNTSEEYPTFALSGRSFAYISYGGTSDFEIWSADADGTNRRRLSASPRAADEWPAWSPDGRHIAWMRRASTGDIWLMDPDGAHKRNLTSTPLLDEQFPAWLPDGRLSFVRGNGRREASYALWTINADGSGPRKLIERVSGWPDWAKAP